MPSIPSLFPIPAVGSALSKDGTVLQPEFAKGAGKFFDEFEWYMRALSAQRGVAVPY